MSAISQEQQIIPEQSYNRENFPIGLLAPLSLKRDLYVLYRFARTADNIADSSLLNKNEALAQLETWQHSLRARTLNTPLWNDLYELIDKRALPIVQLERLLQAFIEDTTRTDSFQNLSDTLDYCALSAVPVGRLLIALCPLPEGLSHHKIDRLTIGLQLLNFYQDIAQDWNELNRCYIEQEDLDKVCITFKYLFKCTLSWTLLKPILDQKLSLYLDYGDFDKYSAWPLFSQTLLTYHYTFIAQQKLSTTDTIFQSSKLKWYDLIKALSNFLYDRSRVLLGYPL